MYISIEWKAKQGKVGTAKATVARRMSGARVIHE